MRTFNSSKCDRSAITDLLEGGVAVDENNILDGTLGLLSRNTTSCYKLKRCTKSRRRWKRKEKRPLMDYRELGFSMRMPISVTWKGNNGDQSWHSNEPKSLIVKEIQGVTLLKPQGRQSTRLNVSAPEFKKLNYCKNWKHCCQICCFLFYYCQPFFLVYIIVFYVDKSVCKNIKNYYLARVSAWTVFQ